RTNIALRYLLHFGHGQNNDTYIGTRVGASWWTDTPVAPSTYKSLWQWGPQYNIPKPSFQILFGYRGYFSRVIGIHLEVGIGTPYLAEAGINFKIK
ncbi:MAG TPA: hypothetical protein VK890_10555, partial [Bacteroidia bacterium]|nr:hypothetical protein [Bacteroidia bacterium]